VMEKWREGGARNENKSESLMREEVLFTAVLCWGNGRGRGGGGGKKIGKERKKNMSLMGTILTYW
jgi:hypothetical protein